MHMGVSICIRPVPATSVVLMPNRVRRGGRVPKEATSEAHLSAERPQAGEATRIPPPHVDSSGPSGDPQPPAEGPRSAVSVIPMRGRASFVDLRRNGFRARSGALGISFSPGAAGAPVVEVGYAISRHVGNAVARNRLRRRLRSALTELGRESDTTLRGGKYVISPGPAAAQLSYRDLTATLRSALKKAALRAEVMNR